MYGITGHDKRYREGLEVNPTPARLPRVAFLAGSDSTNRIEWGLSRVYNRGTNDADFLLQACGFIWTRIHIAPSYFRQSRRWDLDPYDVVFNGISDPDQASSTLKVAQEMLRPLRKPVLNRPDKIAKSTRGCMAQLLSGIDGVIVPAMTSLKNPTPDRIKLRLEQAGMRPPVIIRVAGTHDGNVVGLVRDITEFSSILGDKRTFIATTFVPYQSPDGLYRKFRVWFIGRRMFLQHMLVSEHWNIHIDVRRSFMSAREDLRLEEQSVLEGGIDGLSPEVRRGLEAIRKRVTLDYFGLDFGIVDGPKIVVFEASAQMAYVGAGSNGQMFDYVNRCKYPARTAMTELILNAASTTA